MSSCFLDLNSDVVSEPQSDVSVSGARVSGVSGAEKVVVEPVIGGFAGENPSSGGSVDGTEGDALVKEKQRDGMEVKGFDGSKDDLVREREVVAEHMEMVGDALDKNQSTKIKAVYGSADENVSREANADPGEKIDSPRNGKQEAIAQNAAHSVSELASCPEEENGTVDPGKQVSNVGKKQNNGIDMQLEDENAADGAVKVPHESPDTHSMLETDKEGKFLVSDLVWGKVKSHPWWPGQIFDPSDASEQAMKYYKKDRYLVAYFGDQTFAWNEASSLKPFQTHFSMMEKQSFLEPFRGAIDSALDEVSRRVQLGLSCSCTPEEVRAKFRLPFVCNSGIREDVCPRDGEDRSCGVASFQPDKLVEYVKASALRPCSGGDLLELVIARARLTAFYQWKGYFGLPEFHVRGGLFENDVEYASAILKNDEQISPGKRKMKKRYNSFRRTCEYILEDDMNPARKKRSLSELMGGNNSSVDNINDLSPGERNASNSASPSSGNKRRRLRSRDLDAISSNSRSVKVGERISKIAGRLARSPPPLSYSGEKFRKTAVKNDQSNAELHEDDGSAHSMKKFPRRRVNTRIKRSSPDEMLSQLSLAARDPMKGDSSLSTVVDFFIDYRNIITEGGSTSLTETSHAESLDRNVEPSKYKIKPQGTCNYRSVNECYLSDGNIRSSQEGQKSAKTRKRKKSYQYEIPADEDGSSLEAEGFRESKPSLQSEDRSHVPDDNGNLVTEKKVGQLNEKDMADISPTALILNFTEPNAIPSERDLNEIFSRFGTLSESETEVVKKKRRAKVVFQSRNDAEAAFSSAGKFSTFGPALVSYQLTYLPSKPSPRATRLSRKNTASSYGNTS